MITFLFRAGWVAFFAMSVGMFAFPAQAAYRFSDFTGRPPIHVYKTAQDAPSGMTPDEIKKIYHLPQSGGTGTIAIIDAYDSPHLERDLATFDAQFGLPSCTTKNKCFEKHRMASSVSANSGWEMETALDVEWAHAIAPKAKILLVEAKTPSGANLMNAVDYAALRKNVVAVSMSWGGDEFPDELAYDSHFIGASSGTVFFASSGDDGAGASWPASSPNVVGVGGTSLTFSSQGTFLSEKAWSGSGGGVSEYEKEPDYQIGYKIAKASGMRAIPDVSYDADPASGFPIYVTRGTSKGSWDVVGGTSAGAPQWAAIRALGFVTLAALYKDKASSKSLSYFRDITSGSNGSCKYYCSARKRYDYVTGLGTPHTAIF